MSQKNLLKIHSPKTQIDLVRRMLLSRGFVRNDWAILTAGIWRLASIICDLRKEGHEIHTSYVVKGGVETKITQYTLIKQ